MTGTRSGHLTSRSRNRIVLYSLIVVAIYFACFAFLFTHDFEDWSLGPFFESMIGVFMGAGAIAIITGIILVVQSVIESERDKKQKVFDKKLELYSGIIRQMENLYRLKEDEEAPRIDQEERAELFFTQLKVALLARPTTFRSYSQLINDLAGEDGLIKEEATRLLLDFIIEARDDLDVQEEMTPEDQRSLNESMAIAERAAGEIRKTGRGTYFVGDGLQQYLDLFATPEGRKAARCNSCPDELALETLRLVHRFVCDSFEPREGVSIDYTPSMGMTAFALGKKSGAKFVQLRFETWRGLHSEHEPTAVTTLYLLKSPATSFQVPRLDGIVAAQSRHGFEFYYLRLPRPEDFSDRVRELINSSFDARNDGSVVREPKTKAELVGLEKADLERQRQEDEEDQGDDA